MRNLLPSALLTAAVCALGCDADPVAPIDAATPDAGVDMTPTDPDVGPPADAAPDLAPPPDGAPLDAELLPDGPPLDEGLSPDGPPLDAGLDPDLDPADLGPLDLGPADSAPDARHVVEPLPDGGVDLDWVEVACEDPGWMPGMCLPGEGRRQENAGAGHIAEEIPIEYAESPPASGDHRSRWGRWGEYTYMPPQRYLHNLEHGGIVFLYHPCAEDAAVDALRALARARPDDDTGAFRWILTPYPELPSAIAVLAWEWVYTAECVQPDEIGDFIDRFYRMAPEDVRSDGVYERGWIGR